MCVPHSTSNAQPGTDWYEIRLKGHLDSRWTPWFDGLALRHEPDGTTVILGPVIDQAALHGLLRKVRDVGLPLVSVNQVQATQQTGPNVVPEPGREETRRTT